MGTSIEDKVKEIVSDKLNVEVVDINPESGFSDLGSDSLDTVELLMEFEKEFEIKIPDEDAEKVNTVGDAIDYIKAHTKKYSK